ncbi:MAG TPA: ATPase, T2SS/T4P/T4SS family, partial [Acidobacteriota bacterium]|nr:ATPase, T2SS/T4P/T4SS family [Acidobacteriota bacterium]
DHKKSIITQREVNVDIGSFAEAIRRGLRMDPDVILVGEMRDLDTIDTALLAAETGHLVLSTLHTLDAPESINRVISVFAPHHQRQVRLQLASILKAIISMRLIPRMDGQGRVPAVEVMIATPYIQECIAEKEKTMLIRDAITAGVSQYGMQTFDQSIYQLYRDGYISFEQGMKYSSNPDNFKLRIMGIQSTLDMAVEEMEKGMSKVERAEGGPEEEPK